MGLGAAASETLQSHDTYHNQEAVVILQGCWSSVLCTEWNIPALGYKTDHGCKTQLSGEPVRLLPGGYSNFRLASILHAYLLFLDANPQQLILSGMSIILANSVDY